MAPPCTAGIVLGCTASLAAAQYHHPAGAVPCLEIHSLQGRVTNHQSLHSFSFSLFFVSFLFLIFFFSIRSFLFLSLSFLIFFTCRDSLCFFLSFGSFFFPSNLLLFRMTSISSPCQTDFDVVVPTSPRRQPETACAAPSMPKTGRDDDELSAETVSRLVQEAEQRLRSAGPAAVSVAGGPNLTIK